jgi:hypothetical protein
MAIVSGKNFENGKGVLLACWTEVKRQVTLEERVDVLAGWVIELCSS